MAEKDKTEASDLDKLESLISGLKGEIDIIEANIKDIERLIGLL